jgi:2-polyprenyl-3-methyl-5-hydroxy-6-metoxy-1,4-benzoquinol methylase
MRSKQERWQSEIDYFDREADLERETLSPFGRAVLRRYGRRRLNRCFVNEYRLSLLGDLEGKTVLDIGCGTGETTCLFAHLGARCVGVDISPTAVRVADERAELNQVAERARHVCAAVEDAVLCEKFDAVLCNAFLHHVIPELPLVVERMRSWAKPGALIVISEPISMNRVLRRLRLALPVPLDGTRDERPLEPAELELILSQLAGAELRLFGMLSRLARVAVRRRPLEALPRMLRWVLQAAYFLDAWLLRLPAFRGFAAQAVIHATVPAA